MHDASWNDPNELIAAFKRSDKKAFEHIYYQCNRAMFLAAYRIIHDSSEANGIVNEAFVKFWEKRDSFSGAEKLEPYLVRMTSNLAMDYYRKSKRYGMAEGQLVYFNETHEDPAVQENLIIKSKLVDNVLEKMNEMPAKMQTIFKLFYVHGLDSTEISKRLDISMDTVRVQKYRAIQLLKGIFRWKDLPNEED